MAAFEQEPLLTRAQSRGIDAALIASGVPGVVLMENAGRGAADEIAKLARERGIHRATILAGPGNNGGDGLVVARHLALRGFAVEVLSVVEPSSLKGDAATMRDAWLGSGGAIRLLAGDIAHAWPSIESDLIIDALFGTGLTRPLEGLADAAVILANRRRERPLSIAIDVPSGLDADTGSALGDDSSVFRATHTMTFGTSKPGLHTGFGLRVSGQVIPLALGASLPAVVRTATTYLCRSAVLPPREIDAHKGQNGRVLIVGGSAGTTGAAVLAARGAQRAGAGLVTIASRALAAIDPKILECTSLELPDDPARVVETLSGAIERADAVVVGPGLGRDAWARAVVESVLARASRVVIDADALTLIAEQAVAVGSGVRVMTPHPLEMARLLGRSDAASVNADRLRAARECATRYRSTVVLKGAGSVVSLDDGTCVIAACAEPALGVGGSGDVLAGVIAARLAERTGATAVLAATVQAVIAHGRAGSRARAARGGASRGVTASEIADAVSLALEDRV